MLTSLTHTLHALHEPTVLSDFPRLLGVPTRGDAMGFEDSFARVNSPALVDQPTQCYPTETPSVSATLPWEPLVGGRS